MSKDELFEMAIDAGAKNCANPDKWGILEISYKNLARFAELVAAHEREECAKVIDDWPNGRDDVYLIGVAIRAREEK